MGQLASGLNFFDDSGRSPPVDLKPLFPHFSLRYRTKTSASGMTMTPLVYLMTMPSYDSTESQAASCMHFQC